MTTLVFSSTFEMHYELVITQEEYNTYLKDGINCEFFEEDIHSQIYDNIKFEGCVSSDKKFKECYQFNFLVDGKSIPKFSKFFQNLYQTSFKEYDENIDKTSVPKRNYYSIYYPTSYNSYGFELAIDGVFDLNKLTIEVERHTDPALELFFPCYDGEQFEFGESDDQDGSEWYLINENGEYDSLTINFDDD